jgi:hypothetical protein
VLLDLGIDELMEMRLQALVGPFLVHPPKTRIPLYVGGEDRGETAGGGHP